MDALAQRMCDISSYASREALAEAVAFDEQCKKYYKEIKKRRLQL